MRDFDDRGNNREKIMDLINNDIRNLWGEIYKPEKYRDSKAEDFFDIEFCMLAHKNYQEEQFIEGCEKLRARFDFENADTLYPKNSEKNVPIDGLSVFIDQTWDVIRHQKELNLPDQREMVANYRCNEIKAESIALVADKVEALRKESEQALLKDF
jgi:protein SEY1